MVTSKIIQDENLDVILNKKRKAWEDERITLELKRLLDGLDETEDSVDFLQKVFEDSGMKYLADELRASELALPSVEWNMLLDDPFAGCEGDVVKNTLYAYDFNRIHL